MNSTEPPRGSFFNNMKPTYIEYANMTEMAKLSSIVALRNKIKPGDKVDIVLKKDQRTGNLTRGIVDRLLTSKPKHTRGIKVRLKDGQVGRVDKKVG